MQSNIPQKRHPLLPYEVEFKILEDSGLKDFIDQSYPVLRQPFLPLCDSKAIYLAVERFFNEDFQIPRKIELKVNEILAQYGLKTLNIREVAALYFLDKILKEKNFHLEE